MINLSSKCSLWMALACLGLVASGLAPYAQADEQAVGEPAADEEATGPLVVESVINAPVAEVWKVFTTAEGFKKLGVAQCEMDFRIGGLIRSHYSPQGVLGDEGTIETEILAYEPERVLAFRIHKPPQGFPFSADTWQKTWSVATFTDLGDGQTHVRLTGLGYTEAEESRAMRDFFKTGNAWTMQHLQQQFDEKAGPPPARAHEEPPLAPIHHERVIALPRSAVWKLFATGAGWQRFLEVEATIEPRPGGKFEMLFARESPKGEQGSEGCTVLSLIPEQMLSFTWNAPPKFEHARGRHTWVVVRFEALSPTRTRVQLDHLGFAEQAAANPQHQSEWEQVRGYFQRAWGNVLTALKAQENSE